MLLFYCLFLFVKRDNNGKRCALTGLCICVYVVVFTVLHTIKLNNCDENAEKDKRKIIGKVRSYTSPFLPNILQFLVIKWICNEYHGSISSDKYITKCFFDLCQSHFMKVSFYTTWHFRYILFFKSLSVTEMHVKRIRLSVVSPLRSYG